MPNHNTAAAPRPVIERAEQANTHQILGGSLAVRLDEDQTGGSLAGGGSVAFVPRGSPHTFANPGPAAARMLVLVTPGGFEAYFEALADVLREAGGLPEPSELVALGIEHGSVPA